MKRDRRVHDWRLLKWPFTVTFVYYALIMLAAGAAEASETGFLGVLGLAVGLDAVIYFFYCFFLSRDRDDVQRLWAVFILFYGLLTIPQLQTLWELLMMKSN